MSLSRKLILLILIASMLPLGIFGIFSIVQVRQGTITSVREGNYQVSLRAGEGVQIYLSDALTTLKTLSENLNHIDLQTWQIERVLKNYRNRFDQFNSLTLRTPEGGMIATSDLKASDLSEIGKTGLESVRSQPEYISSFYLKDDLTPAMTAAFPVHHLGKEQAVLIAEINLMHLWYLVDQIQIGSKGFMHVLDQDGYLIATGDGSKKSQVFTHQISELFEFRQEILQNRGSLIHPSKKEEVLAVGMQLPPPLSWYILIEEPASQAYQLAYRISILLSVVLVVLMGVVVCVGYGSGKKNILKPTRLLIEATEELAKGNLDYRIHLSTQDEFHHLAEAFNSMAQRLKTVQSRLLIEERHAVFGRIASGLAHDLKHPIQSIASSARLLEKKHHDPEFRQTFRDIVDREFGKVNRFLGDLKKVTQAIPFNPIRLEIGKLIADLVSTFASVAHEQKVQIHVQLENPEQAILADPTTLNRALSNLVSNALQAMPEGGDLTLRSRSVPEGFHLEIEDTGAGISKERLDKIFEDFMSTRATGLGLGMAIARRILLQHGASLKIESEVGKGTQVIIEIRRDVSQVK